MPKKFDDMVRAIKSQLKKDNPNMSDDKLTSKAFAIATAQWKKSHGGKAPEKAKDWHILEFFVPIQENFLSGSDDFLIKGVAINETTTLNNVKYVAEELEKAAMSFRNVPILLDHKNEVRNIVGRTTENVIWNPTNRRIEFEGKIMDEGIKKMISDKRIGSVSIGAKVDNLTEESDGSMKASGIRGLEISLVAVPGDSGATLAHALENSFMLKEMAKLEEDNSYSNTKEVIDELNNGENKMSTETKEIAETAETTEKVSQDVSQKLESSEEKAKEVKTEVVKTEVVSKESAEMTKLKAQISELKELLKEKKQVKEKVMEDKTKGEVSVKNEEALKDIDNRIVEAIGRNSFAIYRDYGKESVDSKLKRLIR